MSHRKYDGPPIDATFQYFSERNERGGETVDGTTADDYGDIETVGVPEFLEGSEMNNDNTKWKILRVTMVKPRSDTEGTLSNKVHVGAERMHEADLWRGSVVDVKFTKISTGEETDSTVQFHWGYTFSIRKQDRDALDLEAGDTLYVYYDPSSVRATPPEERTQIQQKWIQAIAYHGKMSEEKREEIANWSNSDQSNYWWILRQRLEDVNEVRRQMNEAPVSERDPIDYPGGDDSNTPESTQDSTTEDSYGGSIWEFASEHPSADYEEIAEETNREVKTVRKNLRACEGGIKFERLPESKKIIIDTLAEDGGFSEATMDKIRSSGVTEYSPRQVTGMLGVNSYNELIEERRKRLRRGDTDENAGTPKHPPNETVPENDYLPDDYKSKLSSEEGEKEEAQNSKKLPAADGDKERKTHPRPSTEEETPRISPIWVLTALLVGFWLLRRIYRAVR